MANIDSEEKERTLYCGNLHPDVTEEILYELFLQAGPLEKVKIVANRDFAFITFKHAISVPYTIQLMKDIRLYQRALHLRTRTGANKDLNQASLPNLSYPSATVPSPFIINGTKFLQNPDTPSSMPKVVPVNTPYHRSVSQPNAALNRKPYSESRINETGFVHGGPVKTKLALYHLSHRADCKPYSRTSTPDPRFNEINRNDALKPQVLVSSPIYFHSNMPSAVYWQNQQVAAQRRF